VSGRTDALIVVEKRKDNKGEKGRESVSYGIKAKLREIARKPQSFNKPRRHHKDRHVMDIDFNLKQIQPLSRDV